MPRLTWRKKPRPTGLLGVVEAGKFQPLELRCGGETLATVSYAPGRGYYWYGEVGEKNHNSLWRNVTYTTIDGAKADAKAFVQGALVAKGVSDND